MAEETEAAEKTEAAEEEVAQSYEEDPDEDLYAVLPGKKPTTSLGVGRGREVEEDDTPYHKIEFMHDVPLRLSVEIGQTHLTVRELLGMNVNSVIEFTKVVGEPMDITVSGRLMARGEIVVVNERYGVRISEVTRPDETEQSLGSE